MNRIITYAVDKSDGSVYSRVGHDIAVPVLQWDKIDWPIIGLIYSGLKRSRPRLKTGTVPFGVLNRSSHPNKGDIEQMTHNPNCDGDHCHHETGQVRLYPLGGGANLILCAACWAHENHYRYERGRETKAPENWPLLDWATAEVYGED